ncbi:galaxin-like isoform X2 [Mercenaria mercenaria]|uniref:galaxin-like isoform X2 n=1 Tax=Mercenaria mercenaria TaxID=6596 RepID=UPI00234F2AEB|nr:galaxin-like isoform X2 [Mercenaria mercenaria]
MNSIFIAAKHFCGSERYDPGTQLCCDFKIHQKIQNSRQMACCARSGKEELYPMYEKVCCGEQLVSVPHGHNLECCNGELINRTESTKWDCCGDRDFGMKYSYPEVCCLDMGKKLFRLYQYKEQAGCCGSLEYNIDEENCFYGLNGTYYVEKISPMKTCGKSQYDSDTSLCCEKSGKVIQKPTEEHVGVLPPMWVCWNDEAKDSNKYYFDQNTSRVILKGLVLCGNEEYSHGDKYLKCCGTNLLPVEPEMNVTCCGDKLMNLNDATVSCCDGKFISSSTDGCCDNKPFKKGYNQQCCGRILIDKRTDLCCRIQSSYMTVEQKQHASHTNCCRSVETGRIQTYNKYTEVCERGKVREMHHYDTITIKSIIPEERATKSTTADRKQCPFCSPVTDVTICSKTKVYRFFIYNKRKTKHGTILNGIILAPLEKSGKEINGEKIKIRTRTQCGCFKLRRNFYLITNRKIKTFHKERYNIRFTAEDVFIPEDDSESLAKCLTYQLTYSNKNNHH